MAKQPTIERSENYGYYSDLLWCAVPLTGMAWYYYGLRPVLLMLAALVTAYLCDCALAPLHGEGYRANEPSSECFAALIVLMMPASVSYGIVIVAVIAAVLVKEAFGGEGHYPFHPAAVGAAIAGVSWPEHVYYYPAPGTQLPIWGEINDNLVQGMNESLRSGGLPSASTMNLLTGNVSAGIGTGAALVILACGLFLLVRGRVSWPWEFIRQRIYLEKYTLLSGTALFGAFFLICEPVTMPNRTSSRLIYGAALGIATYAFRIFSPYQSAICFALLIVGAIPEWLDLISHRTERIRFMKKEEQRLAKSTKPE